MAAAMLETPSRVWRRIQDNERRDMPSLPSLPAFEASDVTQSSEDMDESDGGNILSPIQSTPAAFSSHSGPSTVRPTSSTNSVERFARSIASRSVKSSASITHRYSIGTRQSSAPPEGSFDISPIPSLPKLNTDELEIRSSDQDSDRSRSHGSSVGDAYLPPDIEPEIVGEDDLDITDALRSISRSNSPDPEIDPTPRKSKNYDYSVSLRSEPKPSPFDKFRNISYRRPLSRTRTPSLTHTATPSPNSSVSAASTPGTNRSITYPRSQTNSPLPGLHIPLPRSATASPTAAFSPRFRREEEHHDEVTTENEGREESPHQRSMDLSFDTDIRTETTNELAHSTNTDAQEQDEREPTFSSEEGMRSSMRDANSRNSSNMPSPAQLAAFSSPAPSTLLTPTPVFQPRPRARFNVIPQMSTTPADTLPDEEFHAPQEDTTWRASDHQQQQGGHEQEESQEGEDDEGCDIPDDPATPFTHKRSFLLSVINSTAKPRRRFLPTPHPRKLANDTTIIAPQNTTVQPAETPVPATPSANLHTAFAGITPRPRGAVRRRFSHGIGGGLFTPAPASTIPETASESETGSAAGYETENDRVSFISTTSSQDLTTHARANQSFDPIIGLGERGHGVGRFNAGKLNSYLHGLNRKLQEENEGLVARLREYEEKFGSMVESGSPGSSSNARTTPSSSVQSSNASRRTSGGGGRRVSIEPLGLHDVAEESGESLVEEKAALEEMVEELKESLEKATAEREEAERALEAERSERSRDKERWRERMDEVQQGVEKIIRDLETKTQDAEERAKAAEEDKVRGIKDAERRLAEVIVERDVLAERVEQAEAALSSGKDLGAEVNAANERVAQVMSELKNASIQMRGLEDEVMRADGRIDALEKELKEEKEHNSELQAELRITADKFGDTVRQVETLTNDLNAARDELQGCKEYIAQLEEDAGAAVARIETLEEQVENATKELEAASAEIDEEAERAQQHEEEAERNAELARQMEDALEAAEERMRADEEEIASLKAKISALERELDKSRSVIEPSRDPEAQAEIDALEAELEEAHKEVARLKTALDQSPARKAIERAKDAKIELLEKEKEDLQERLRSLKNQSMAFNTPNKTIGTPGISPANRRLSLKSPKTPGGPLRDLSWLHTTMGGDSTMAPLVAEIERLQQQLEQANEDIDDKLDRLEDAGMGVISLTQQLEEAKAKTTEVEQEMGRLTRREERRLRRLSRARCQKCRTRVDLRDILERAAGDESSILEASMVSFGPTEPPTPPTKTSEKLRENLRAVNEQLHSMKNQWDEERQKLLGENAVLQDATKRLNTEVRNARTEIQKYADNERAGERSKAVIQSELDRAKRAVEDLEQQLSEERSRLRALTTEQTKAQRQKEKVELQLRRTESDMAEVKQQLQRIKQENHDLETELRSNANADQKARLLEQKVSENAATIEQLRQERSMLVADHKNLQRKYTEVSEHVNKLKEEHAAGQISHDHRRHELDLQVLEIEDLKRALAEQATELQRASEQAQRAAEKAQRMATEKDRLASEKDDIARTVSQLEADLRRVRRDAEAFGRDLKLLRSQKDKLEEEKEERKEQVRKMERAQKQSESRIRVLTEELDRYKEKMRESEDRWRSHVCAADEQQLVAVKAQHKNECKGLVVQIKYLKAKFTRESVLRSDLGYQKRYLLALLDRSQRTEVKILAAIARIGFPTVEPPSSSSSSNPPKRLKTIALSLIFIRRAERASEAWRQQSASKEAVAAALQDVRRRRVTSSDTNAKSSAPPVATSSKGKERAYS
ncbi:hypothetical protein K474DRAFT_413030 [Panus rudis PR-1116 ss-1]|nr:hypothetical protein K474DRAFT_413030 [Panus rudis PR-1116 ss-1]